MTGVETALAIAAVVSAVAGTAVSVDASNKQAKFQGQVAQMNADIEAENAARAITQGQIEAQEQDRISAGIIGEQISSQSGSGLSATSGSFALGRRSSRELARLDALNVAQRGNLAAFNARVSQANFLAERSAAQAAGSNAILGGVLSGVGQAASGTAGILAANPSLVGGSTSFTPGRFTGTRPGR